jgi:hypothetical protein
MELIDGAENMFKSYFKLFKKQPTKNPESNIGILNLAMETLAYPAHLNDSDKYILIHNWNTLKYAWVDCTLNPSEEQFNLIESMFNHIITYYKTNNVIVNWYKNEYKQILTQTPHNIEDNKYEYTIKNLQHHASSYESYFLSKYS